MNYYGTFKNSRPSRDYKACLEHDEKIGVGTKGYELKRFDEGGQTSW